MAVESFTSSTPPPPRPTTRQPSRLFWGAVAAFIATRIYLLTAFVPWYSDIPLYFKYAVDTHDLGLAPYRQEKIEYPPLSYEAMVLPRLFDREKVSPAIAKYVDWTTLFSGYQRSFQLLMGLGDMLGFTLFALTLAHRRRDLLAVGCWGYVVTTALLGHVLYTRLDAGLLALLMVWAYAWTRSRNAESQLATPLAYLAVGLGVSYKLVPAVMVPFLLLADWQVGGGWRRFHAMLRGLGYLGVGVLLPYLPLLRSSGTSLLNWLHFHADRGVEVESVYASLMMALAPLGLSVHAFQGPGSWDVDSSLASILTRGSTWFVAIALTALALTAWVRRTKYNRDKAFDFACLAVLLTVTLSKVLSPQYFVWCFPLVLLWGANVLAGREFALFVVATVVVAVLTSVVFPYLFFGDQANPAPNLIVNNPYPLVPPLHPLPCTLVALRNALWLAIVAWLTWAMLTRRAAIEPETAC